MKYLLQDLTAGQQRTSKKGQTKDTAAMALSPAEELVMLLVLGSSIDAASNADEKDADDTETGRLELGRKLAEDVTKLLAKFQAEPSCSAIVVSFVRRINPEVWFSTRMARVGSPNAAMGSIDFADIVCRGLLC